MSSDTARIDLRGLAARGEVHFVGVAGAGMSALAELEGLKNTHQASSDQHRP